MPVCGSIKESRRKAAGTTDDPKRRIDNIRRKEGAYT